MASISTRTSLGRRATSTVERGGAALWEEALVDIVHGGELVHVLEIDPGAHDLVQAAARRLQDRFQVGEHLLGLLGHSALDDLLGRRVQRNLPADKDEAVGPDGLRIGADGLRGIVRGDDFAHGLSP